MPPLRRSSGDDSLAPLVGIDRLIESLAKLFDNAPDLGRFEVLGAVFLLLFLDIRRVGLNEYYRRFGYYGPGSGRTDTGTTNTNLNETNSGRSDSGSSGSGLTPPS